MPYALLLLPLTLWGEPWRVETLPMVHLKDARRYVCNPDGVLSAAAVDSLDARLRLLERDKGIESVVIAVERISPDDPYDFAMQLGRKYGIGSKTQRSGLIVLLATRDRSYQILTGSGLEIALPDALCRRIQNRVMVPALRQGHWDEAMLSTLAAIDAVVRGDEALRADLDDSGSEQLGIALMMVIIFGGIAFVSLLGYTTTTRRCRKCRHYSLKLVRKKHLRIAGKHYERQYWVCRRCGHEETRDVRGNSSSGAAAAGGIPPVLFGGGGLSGGGGIGGSFGGGTFSGGGSGGRF